MNKKIAMFCELLYSQVDKGIYVWGGNGQDLNAMSNPIQWIRDKETSPENADRAIHLYETRKKNGVNPLRAFDCSGLMYWAGKQVGVFEKDINSKGMYARCKDIPTDSVETGDFLFRIDATGVVCHVGMYVGNNKYIDCMGRDSGVVEGKYNASKWHYAGRLSALSDNDDPEPSTEYVHPKGNVRVRTGNGSGYTQIRPTATKKDYLPYLGQAEEYPNWYLVEWQGRTGYISSKPRYTEVIERAD